MMNRIVKPVLVFVTIMMISLSGEARQQTRQKPSIDTISSVQSSTEAFSMNHRFALGVAALSNVTLTTTALTGFYSLDNSNDLQFLFSIPGTSPFQFSMGTLLKHSLTEGQGAGFHVGGGFGMGAIATGGTSNTFAMTLHALGGLHFRISSDSRIMIHIDGGPSFSVANSTSNFAIGAFSSLLGVTIAYIF